MCGAVLRARSHPKCVSGGGGAASAHTCARARIPGSVRSPSNGQNIFRRGASFAAPVWCPCSARPVSVLAGRRPSSGARPTDIRIVEVDHRFEEFRYRAPYQFGGRTVDRVTLAQRRVPGPHGRRQGGVGLRVDDARQRVGLSAVPHDAGAGRDEALAAELRAQTAACDESGHPIDLFRALEPAYLRAPTRCRADARCPRRSRSCACSSSPAPLTPPSTTRTARPSA